MKMRDIYCDVIKEKINENDRVINCYGWFYYKVGLSEMELP